MRCTKLLYALLVLSLLSACGIPTGQLPPGSSSASPQPQLNMVTFRLTLPQPLAPGDSLYLTLLDEVTGLAFNPQQFVMEAEDAQHYVAILPLPSGALVKYRYTRTGAIFAQEHLPDGRPVRYRLFHVEGPGLVQDSLSRWTDTTYQGPTGRITGQVLDPTTSQPLANIYVTAAGVQTLTLADGTFLLEGLPPGTHNMLAFSLDGAYKTYQQGAVVAADSTTPVSLSLTLASQVTVAFTVTLPDNTPAGAPIRLAGSLYQLGNTFADLSGGVSVIAARMPTLSRLPNGRYMVALHLPAGSYLEYKYTLGDGFWSAEHNQDGSFRIRQLIVPEQNTEISDVVDTWQIGETTPVQFNATVAAYMPYNETVSIQFNPGYGWMAPLPMWQSQDSAAAGMWSYILTSPLNGLENLRYRYCRSDQCGVADDAQSLGPAAVGRLIDPALGSQPVNDVIQQWAWLSNPAEQANVPNLAILPRPEGFIAGVAFEPYYHPSWGSRLPFAVSEVGGLSANWLILSPTWTYTHATLPILEPDLAYDMPWLELENSTRQAASLNIQVGLYPNPRFPASSQAWWAASNRDFAWWTVWFEQYARFMLNYADFAARNQVSSLLLGGEAIAPALPGGLLSDRSPSNVPEDAGQRWRDLLSQLRLRYPGKIAWVLTYPGGIQNPPPFLDLVDQVYILFAPALTSQADTPPEALAAEALRILSTDILPFQQSLGKPVILALTYPSASGALIGCVADGTGACLRSADLIPLNPALASLPLNLQEQEAAYNAVLVAVNQLDWVGGIVSMGYYPPTMLQDPSISVNGKPASGVLWYWYPRLLGR